MRIRTLVGLTLLSGFGALALHGMSPREPRGARAPASESVSHEPTPALPENAQNAPTVAKTMKRVSLWPEDGHRWIYRFERKALADYQGKTWLSLKLGGRAAVEAIGKHGDNRFFLFTFETDRFEMQGQTRVGRQTFPSIRMEIDPEGKLREMRWAVLDGPVKVPSEEDADFVKDLASQWLFFERSTRMGLADVEWTENASNPTLISVSKRVTAYPGRPELSKLDSNHEWIAGVQDGMAKVERLEGTENYVIGSPNGDFEQQTSYRWLWTGTEQITTFASIQGIGAMLEVSAAAEKPVLVNGKRLELKEFISNWPKLSKLTPHARLKLFQDVKRALDLGQNELIAVIVKSLEGKRVVSIEWRTGVGALAATINPEAQKALVSLYQDSKRMPEEKLSILAGVTAGEGTPAPDWKGILEGEITAVAPPLANTGTQLATEYDSAAAIREASLYALGSTIRKTEDLGKRRELEGILWKEIKDARSEPAQAAVLEAIGNSGSSEYYAYIKEQAVSSSSNLRARAAGAVRFLAADLARPILDTARVDSVPSVRKAALWSESFLDTASSPQ